MANKRKAAQFLDSLGTRYKFTRVKGGEEIHSFTLTTSNEEHNYLMGRYGFSFSTPLGDSLPRVRTAELASTVKDVWSTTIRIT